MLLSGKLQGRTLAKQRTASVAQAPKSVVRGAYGRGKLVVRQAIEVPPSRATAANELESLSRLSSIVPDTLAFETLVPGAKLAAASVSASTLRSVLVGESLGHKPYENAINAALAAGGATASSPLSATSDPLDRAMVNVGAMLAECVSGRVETVVDPRLANDEAALVSKVRQLAAAYELLHVLRNRLVFALPATWAGTQAARALEADGIATTIYMVYSMAQGVAAMQAGASVVRIAVGRIHDWYDKNPGVIRNPHGPREDSGAPTSYDPGLELVKELYCYGRRFHPKTKIMATSLRNRKDVLELAGVDYLVLPGRVMRQLEQLATDQVRA
ncbi:hypothetical protein VOLCADRAFT_81816 [Volvox carteri f. nagariensis]|uniref:Transaldolase n=1 Tax=Volvox carteri f. nagariensis TaxID=3068 RepID=D8U127_VOLCA|nr:uncharacterized protein VOLCADRAFT_81816 [Volvox carteri f. nagariensis]EFJ46559.1 hypothetical protein VOLCADRAFT_81816 [Volvox carteri f. nagariensis]|eukprot:XP_002952416.1 hypothetical protein VOLCADRAFT_81816 [Volvox carteri f. nagariensis]